MQRTAATRAASSTRCIGEIAIKRKQQMVEGGVGQQVLIQGCILLIATAPTSMAKPAPKPGRNDPCHCGSGNKYKKCCLAKDQAAERAAMDRLQLAEFKAAVAAHLAGAETEDADEDALDAASNAVVDLVRAARLDEAEAAARDLLRRFPDVHDGWDRLGMVHEARGDNRQAADCYRRVIDFVRRHPDRYDSGMGEQFARLVAKLDPPTAT
jgi:tetratricopeptide (TPR) repeat protein